MAKALLTKLLGSKDSSESKEEIRAQAIEIIKKNETAQRDDEALKKVRYVNTLKAEDALQTINL